MKILFLNPQFDAAQEVLQALRVRGLFPLYARNNLEAQQILSFHGRTIELAFIHRESADGSSDAGIQFYTQLKNDPEQADLPVVITSAQWSEAEFGTHQSSELGAHAYLKFPFENANRVVETIEQIFSTHFGIKEDLVESKHQKLEMEAVPQNQNAFSQVKYIPFDPDSIILEDAKLIYNVTSDSAIKLEPPELPPEPVFAPPASAQKTQQKSASADILIADSIPQAREEEEKTIQSEPVFDPSQVPDDSQQILERELPYLTQRNAMSYVQPVGDAVVPGGAASTPDTETLKKYLLLREQDVAALSSQLKSARDQIINYEESLKMERARASELNHLIEEQKKRINDFEGEKSRAIEEFQNEIQELRFQSKAKSEKAKVLEVQVREAAEEMERLKERVRADIRKIRVREKELENKLEILKKDSEALLGARENKIVDLKRKLDLLEFNMDLLQDQYAREKENNVLLKERLQRALQAVRVAGGLLDGEESGPEQAAS